MNDEEETPLSEIHILPDGRVYLFGAGRELLDVVAVINQHDEMLLRRREACRAAEPVVAALQDHPLPLRERVSECALEGIRQQLPSSIERPTHDL